MNRIRLDGRACNEIRPIKIKSNIFKNYAFSTEISIGATKILSYMIENHNYEKIYDCSLKFLKLGLNNKKTQLLDSISKFLISISNFIITNSIIKFSFFIIEDDGNIEFALCNCITRLLMASKKIKFEIIFNSICAKKKILSDFRFEEYRRRCRI